MTLRSNAEFNNTRDKLRELEARYDVRCRETAADQHVHELTLQSLKRQINQLKEEIALFEVRQTAGK